MDTTTPQGTTVAILQHYLDAGLLVRWTRTGTNHRLTGLVARIQTAYLDEKYSVNVEDITPLLLDFSDLITPLADGTVPAVEVAKILLKEEQEWRNEGPIDWDAVTVETDGHEIDLWLHGRAEIILTLWPDWEMQEYREAARPWNAAYDYLRSKHFACGLSPEQYIKKQP